MMRLKLGGQQYWDGGLNEVCEVWGCCKGLNKSTSSRACGGELDEEVKVWDGRQAGVVWEQVDDGGFGKGSHVGRLDMIFL